MVTRCEIIYDRFLENIIHERQKVMNCIREGTGLVGPGKVTMRS